MNESDQWGGTVSGIRLVTYHAYGTLSTDRVEIHVYDDGDILFEDRHGQVVVATADGYGMAALRAALRTVETRKVA